MTLPIKIADLAFFNDDDKRFEVDNGVYGIQISTSSADADIQQRRHDHRGRQPHAEAEVLTARPRVDDATTSAASRSACCSRRTSTSTRA